MLATLDERGTVLYDVAGLHEQTIVAHHAAPVMAICFAPPSIGAEPVLACMAYHVDPTVGRAKGELTLWDIRTGHLIERLPISEQAWGAARPSLAHHPRQPLLAFTSAGVLRLWPLGQPPKQLPEEQQEWRSLAFSGDGGMLWGAVERNLCSWRSDTLSATGRWTNDALHLGSHRGLKQVGAGTDWVVVGSRDASVKLFCSTNGSRPAGQFATEGPVSAVAIAPDETLVASGTEQGKLQLYRIPGGERVGKPETAHRDEIQSIAFCPTEPTLLATGSRDGKIRLWSVSARGPTHLMSMTPHKGRAVISVQFSPDGRKLAVLMQNETAVRLWDLQRLRRRFASMHVDWHDGEG